MNIIEISTLIIVIIASILLLILLYKMNKKGIDISKDSKGGN